MATIERVSAIPICIRRPRKPRMQVSVEKTVEQQVHDPFLPRRDIESAPLAIKVVFESDRRAEMESLVAQLLVDGREPAEAAGRQIVKCFAVGGNVERLPPEEQRLGIDSNRGLVEFRFTIEDRASECAAAV